MRKQIHEYTTINRRFSLDGQIEAKIWDGGLECNNKPVVKSKIGHMMNTEAKYDHKGWIEVTEGCIVNLFVKCIAWKVLLLYISILIEISLYKYVV